MRRVKKVIAGACCLIVFALSAQAAKPDGTYVLWYTAPATDWKTQCLPIGNGSLGAMLFGGVAADVIQYNETTLWRGGSQDDASSTTTSSRGNSVPFGYINVAQTIPTGTYTNYQRDLNIGNATAHVSFTANSINFKREYLCSYPDSVMVIHYTASSAGSITLTVSAKADSVTSKTITASGSTITTAGYMSSGSDPANLLLESQIYIKNYNGTLAVNGSALTVTGADSVDIIMAASTNFQQSSTVSWRGTITPHIKDSVRIAQAAAKTYPALRAAHIADYQNLFNRFTLDLNDSTNKGVATDTRRSAYAVDTTANAAKDRGLEVLYTQYGRYLIIASSRNSLPANLQGNWNMFLSPRYSCDYHSDINVEMNYSHVLPLNLSECMIPYINFIDAQRTVRTARTLAAFPGSKGWTVRTETNHMGGTAWDWNKPGSAWYCNGLWNYFQFTLDTNYLKNTALPIMKEVCQFWQWHLADSNGTLETPDGWSPENGPANAHGIAAATAYDQQHIWGLFSHYVQGQNIARTDTLFRDTVAAMLAKLDNGVHIGTHGDIKEWPGDYAGYQTNHRHLSHLICIYPGDEVSPMLDTVTAKAGIVSLTASTTTVPNARADGSTGWSCAWRADCLARLFLANRAYRQLALQLTSFVWSNLFDACLSGDAVMQVDGNFGFPSAVAEMLIQSHTGLITLLPALPAPWAAKGSATGLRARGAFTVGITWNNGKLNTATIHSDKGATCKLRIDTTNYFKVSCNNVTVATTPQGTDYKLPVISFPTTAGSDYVITYGTSGIVLSKESAATNAFGFVVKRNRVEFAFHEKGEQRIEIITLQGKTVFSAIIDGTSFVWNCASNSGSVVRSGRYIVRVTFAGKSYEKKLILMNNR